MEKHISRLESCSIVIMPNRRNDYDDVLSCKVLSHTTWMFFPVTEYYTIRFYFDNSLLQDITVGTWWIGL